MRAMMKSAVLVIIFTAALFLPMFTEDAASEEVSEIEVNVNKLENDKSSKRKVMVEITKAKSVLEDRVKMELVHGSVKLAIDR